MPNPNAQSSTLTPKYRWNATAARYIDARGNFVPAATVRRALERQIARSTQNIDALSRQLQAGEIDLQEWRTGMLRELKTAHVASAAAAKGGWAQMSPADYGRAGGMLQYQYEKLNRFASQIQYGTQKLDGRFRVRAKMYGNAARTTYSETKTEAMQVHGFDEEQNVLGAADHCDGCLEETARGWVPIGTLVPIGQRDCKTNCHCSKRFRNSQTGEIMKE